MNLHNRLHWMRIICLLLIACSVFAVCQAAEERPANQEILEADIASAIERAGKNGDEIRMALETVGDRERQGMQFLIQHMPERDLQSLSSDFLLEHVNLAYAARAAASWGEQIPESIFLNEVLPYACVNERRDDVRCKLRDQFWPSVKDCVTISSAAAKLNDLVFRELNVKYSTKRRRADQGPAESMESGIASCTGLSILLIDACRACGIPARFVGTPLWSDGSGNHSWVEIWDHDWHFTGAAEPVGEQLDQAWFVERASKSKVGDRRHGIFAVSFARTEQTFPLIWSRGNDSANAVYAVEVTQRYAKPQKNIAGNALLLRFRALNRVSENRCVADLVVRNGKREVVFRGQTKGESADANDHVTTRLEPGRYSVEIGTGENRLTREFEAKEDGQLVSFETDLVAEEPAAEQKGSTESNEEPDSSEEADPIVELTEFLRTNTGELSAIDQQDFARQPLSRSQAEKATELVSEAHAASVRRERKAEHEAKVLTIGELQMPLEWTVYGEKPAKGHSLVISMHGGGNAPKRVNDRQWENQKKLYQLEEGIYVAPRAPTDTWNLWHEAHIDQFFTRLIENMIVFEGVDPNRVYITGYSAGGDGTFQLAPRMADQLAAAAMMAGHPNETRPDGLRNLPFTLHMGANDAAYDRNKKAAEWKVMLAELRQADPQGYNHWVEIHADKGHWMDRQDAKGVEWLFQFERNITPERIVWLQDDRIHTRFYWLGVPESQAKGGARIVAEREGNTIRIEQCDPSELTIYLRDDMLDLDEAVKIEFEGQELFSGQVTRNIATIASTLIDRGDPTAVFTAQVTVNIPKSPKTE